jgi:alanyl-tRNA synthetase
MDSYQTWMISLGVGGFLLTAGLTIGGCVWAVARIKEDVTNKIAEERSRTSEIVDAERENFQRSMKKQTEEFQRCLKEITEKFTEEQKAQDQTHGTMGISLRGASPS